MYQNQNDMVVAPGIIIEGGGVGANNTPDISQYKRLSEEQFVYYAITKIKDFIYTKIQKIITNPSGDLYKLHYDFTKFFNTIPKELVKFNTECEMRILQLYVTSNIQTQFMIELSYDEETELYNLIRDLKMKDPRIMM